MALRSGYSIEDWVAFIRMVAKEAEDRRETAFASNEPNGDWDWYLADEEGYAGAILLGIHPNGKLELVDNTELGNSEEPWRR